MVLRLLWAVFVAGAALLGRAVAVLPLGVVALGPAPEVAAVAVAAGLVFEFALGPVGLAGLLLVLVFGLEAVLAEAVVWPFLLLAWGWV